ncbi:MAG TPA: rhodanese-like domain-containing protein [Anaerolineales bacterium]|nr:rhodanese-like domain-containing protein [Anaerolineales bacterium]
MPKKHFVLLAISILVLSLPACNAQATQTELPPTTTQIVEATLTQLPAALPLTEAEVPRVSVQEAKVAFDSGEALIVDVRSPEAYAASHVPGALNVSLGEIETNPAGLKLAQDQWIITYCT